MHSWRGRGDEADEVTEKHQALLLTPVPDHWEYIGAVGEEGTAVTAQRINVSLELLVVTLYGCDSDLR